MTKILEALHAFQAEVPRLQRDAINPHFGSKYLTLESLLQTVVPLLNERGIVLTQEMLVLDGGEPGLRTVLTHVEDGSYFDSTLPLVLDRPNAQGLGSGITYGRRYGLVSLLGLSADRDDDANAAVETSGSGASRPRRRTTTR